MEITDTYLSLAKTSESLYKEIGSKFLVFAYPVENEQQVKEILVKKYFKIVFPYTATNEIMQLIQQYQLEIVSQRFEQDCLFELAARKNKWKEVQKNFTNFMM